MLTLRTSERATAALVEAMLAEGILRETDWCGTLGGSLHAGIGRWTRELLDGEDLGRVELVLSWMDDVSAPRLIGQQQGTQPAGFDTRLWLQAAPGRNPEEPVGMLAIVRKRVGSSRYPEERDCFIGRRVLEIEEAWPGAGWQALYMLAEVLPLIVNAATPHYGHSQISKYEWLLKVAGSREAIEAVGINPPIHNLTMDEYLQHVPLEACDGELRPGILREALRHPLPDHLRPLVERAWELDRLRKVPHAVFVCDSSLFLAEETRIRFMDTPGGAAKESSFSLRWCREDLIPRIVDDYHHQIRSRQSETDILWCQGWQACDPRGTRKAVRHWKQAVTLALRGCRLAELLHSEEFP